MKNNFSKMHWSKLLIGLALIFCLVVFISLGCSLKKDDDKSTSSGSSGSLTPNAPTELVITPNYTTVYSIALTWKDNSEENGFYVERKTPSTIYNRIATLPANATAYTNTGLVANTIYYYRIKSYNYAGESSPSNEQSTLTSWDITSQDGTTPLSRTDHSTVWTGSKMIIWGGWNGQNTLNTGAIYDPSNDTWTSITTNSSPAARRGHSAVWADEIGKMIVWGGYTTELSDNQLIERCETEWTERAITGGVTTSLSTDKIEGNYSAQIEIPLQYDPATETILASKTIAPTNFSARTTFSFWIKTSENIPAGTFAIGLRQNDDINEYVINTTLNKNAGVVISLPLGTPANLTQVEEILFIAKNEPGIVTVLLDDFEAYGGGDAYYNSGGIYNPDDGVNGSWTAITVTNVPDARALHSAVWTGSQMIVWGGKNGSEVLKNGGIYNPTTNKWETSSQKYNLISGSHINNPIARSKHLAFWTGSGTESWSNKMIIWGGENGGSTGGIYNIATDTWSQIGTTNAPTARWGFSWVWTGTGTQSWHNKIIVWGGYNGTTALNDGALYNPADNSWTALPESIIAQRMYHTAVWTGTKMLVWGGDGALTTGATYNPSTNIWSKTTTVNAPPARLNHSAVWTGGTGAESWHKTMIIWGGSNGINFYNSGGRYKSD